MVGIQRTYKDRLFCALFGSEKRKALTLELYNALNGTHYTNAADIQINTIEDVLYFGMRNDVSFLLANELNLYEQQSSQNPNMPLRAFCYAEHVLENYLYDTGKNNEIYDSTLVKIPTPKIVVLYNVDEGEGSNAIEDHEMRLSDSFEAPGGDIEVIVHAYNINSGRFLPSICTPLRDYSQFVDDFRRNARHAKTREERIAAADAALAALPEGEVKSYILSQKSEVIDMLLTEFDEKKFVNYIQEKAEAKGRAEGLAEGKVQGKAEGLAEGEARGKSNTIIDLIKTGLLTLEQGAAQLGISADQMSKMVSVR